VINLHDKQIVLYISTYFLGGGGVVLSLVGSNGVQTPRVRDEHMASPGAEGTYMSAGCY
jgi:hypothetical protein